MNYGKLVPSESFRSGAAASGIPAPPQERPRRRRYLLLASLGAVLLLLVGGGAASLGILLAARRSRSEELTKPSEAISRTCAMTRYPALCISSLVNFPGAMAVPQNELVHVAVNVTLRHVGRAFYRAAAIANLQMEKLERAAYEDCMELMEDSVDQLRRSLAAIAAGRRGPSAADADVRTWLSAALTNQDTCAEGLAGVAAGPLKDQLAAYLEDLWEMASNSLAIFAGSSGGDDFSEIPIQNRRRRLMGDAPFPAWVTGKDRSLLETPAVAIEADLVVAQDGSGRYETIQQAVKAAPEHSTRRIIIHIKAGRYEENVKVGRKKTNLMFIGDGRGKTIVSGNLSVSDRLTTFHTATFAAMGTGFVARDMTFENTAGPAKHQAVALRVGADRAVVYRCDVLGYQDTLYVHSQRQFYRDCAVAGTVDFVFGNAAVVLQNCTLYARRPLEKQKNTITAQGRKDPNQNTGISIHVSRVLPSPELAAAEKEEGRHHRRYPTFLGRPWKAYSRTVFMLSHIAGHVHPAGWLEWDGDFAVDTLYYGEYRNSGDGAAVGLRVNWPGYRVIAMEEEAAKFTVRRFIHGTSWLPSTGVAFLSGLTP
ncbi:unnamed protein product [Spirodela intermedia]|uniref:Pectinesterase n=1 Tax=Spirodela intermedia TaxID=51605 RepID=A0A7I8KI25_SPIIN|nr:unnamed protein product [Spirodela intermedia]